MGSYLKVTQPKNNVAFHCFLTFHSESKERLKSPLFPLTHCLSARLVPAPKQDNTRRCLHVILHCETFCIRPLLPSNLIPLLVLTFFIYLYTYFLAFSLSLLPQVNFLEHLLLIDGLSRHTSMYH